MSIEPYIYVIDIDGTLIGDITHQVAEWEIICRYEPKKIKQFKSQVIHQLQNGMLRPGVADFVTSLKNNNENSEFFLYTASDDKWAQFLVPCIEAACGIKFGRPIFSRKHCLYVDRCLKKSLLKISNMVHTKLKSRYTFKRPSHVYDNMILIDNNKVLIDKEWRKAIICPSYEYALPYDILRLLDMNTLESNALSICKILVKYGLVDEKIFAKHAHSNAYSLLAAYYDEYADSLRHMARVAVAQERHKRDKFWPIVANAINALQHKKVGKEAMVKYINSKLKTYHAS